MSIIVERKISKVIYLTIWCFIAGCTHASPPEQSLKVGAERIEQYLSKLSNRKMGAVVNATSRIGGTHLVDSLISLDVNIVKIFAPEHGFRGDQPDGAKVLDGKDSETGLPIISLYGKTKKPTPKMMEGLDIMVFDIQDVGARFYTFLSTMHYVMEACAENNIPLLVLDRPNPNGHYVDGPVLEMEHQSFVGMHPIPIVHGMTLGELAQMINGEGWLEENLRCKLEVIKIENWDHGNPYQLPVRPSPNLPSAKAINLYPSLCLFEGTVVSAGRGTDHPFTIIGHPQYPIKNFRFKPISRMESQYPKYENKWCFGQDLNDEPFKSQLDLSYLIQYHTQLKDSVDDFFQPYFTRLAGTRKLQSQIERGDSESEIRASWQPALEKFKRLRKKYLLYEDF